MEGPRKTTFTSLDGVGTEGMPVNVFSLPLTQSLQPPPDFHQIMPGYSREQVMSHLELKPAMKPIQPPSIVYI